MRSISKGDRTRAEVMRRNLLGESPKAIAAEMGISSSWVYLALQAQGMAPLSVTKAERAAIMAARIREAS